MSYITTEDLVEKFGADWATADDLELYLGQINGWLYGYGVPEDESDPKAINRIRIASFFLARAAKEDALYISTDNIKSQKGSAQSGTSFEVQYVAYKNAENRWVKAAKDYLIDYNMPSLSMPLYKIN